MDPRRIGGYQLALFSIGYLGNLFLVKTKMILRKRMRQMEAQDTKPDMYLRDICKFLVWTIPKNLVLLRRMRQ